MHRQPDQTTYDLERVDGPAQGGETELLEFKRTTGERREGTSSLCAMLNHRGGHVVFGVAPDGKVLGQQVSDHTIEELAQEIARVDPPGFPAIDCLLLGDRGLHGLLKRLGLVESRGHGRGAFWRFVPQGFESEPE